MSKTLFAFIFWTAVVGASLGYEAPDDCDWSFIDEESGHQGGISLTCHLSAINSNIEKTNFSVIPGEGTKRLIVKCSDASLSHLDKAAFASLYQLEELILDGCRLEHLPPLAFEGLTLLKKLTIQTNHASTLSVAIDAFVGLPSLTHLDLSNNFIRSIPQDELCQLSSLKHLNISKNELRSFDDLGLATGSSSNKIQRSSSSCISGLISLDLSGNEITSLKSFSINSLFPELKDMRLNKNFIRFVEGDSSAKPRCNLRHLDLSDNQISSLPSGIFRPCEFLTELRLANNSLSTLEETLFDGLGSLKVLDLSGNLLVSSQLKSRLTRDLVSISELILSRNQIDRIADVFAAMSSSLKVLKLDHNGLTSLPTRMLSVLSVLKELDLSNNHITNIESGAFQGLGSLTHLLLGQNKMSNFANDVFNPCPQLLVLDLSHNRLATTPAAISALRQLQTLDLSENMIADISEAPFLAMKHLWRLQLNGNLLSNITVGLFSQLTAIQILDLSSNKISHIEKKSLDSNRNLQAVRLDNNELSSMSGLFNNLSALMWLNMSANQISEFDYSMLPLNLRWLDISHNKISDLGNYFDLTGELKLAELDVSFNALSILGPHNIPDSIETLLVNDNKISQLVPYTFFKKVRLSKVDLTVNNLNSIDRNALRLSSDVTRIPEFFLTGNPIECNCEMVWFKSINSPDNLHNYPLVSDIESIYCRLVYARERAFVPLVEADNEQFLCPYTTHCFALCQCCDFDACDCEMACPDNCTCFHDSAWSKNIAVCSNSGFEDLPEKLPMDATEIFLDGNLFPEMNSHTFIGRKNLRVLHLNNSQIHTIQNRTFVGLKSLTGLYLQDNKLTSLEGFEFEALANLRELYLENNLIEKIANVTFKFLHSLEVLNLQGNKIVDFSAWELALNPFLVSVKLAENLWTCDCGFADKFRSWMNAFGAKVSDGDSVKCFNDNNEPILMSQLKTCPSITDDSETAQAAGNSALAKTRTQDFTVSEDYLPLMAASLATFAVILLLLLVAFVYRNTLRVWLHAKFGLRVFENADAENGRSEDIDNNKLFDAFISYSVKDEVFVREVLAGDLERPELGYRTCLYHRDLPTSPAFIADTLLRATDVSRRTIIVLSENFLKSEWSRYDYKSGFHQAMRSGRRKLIVVVVGDVSSRDVDPDLRLYLKTNVVLNWGDRLFWEKLRYALPDPAKTRPTASKVISPSLVSSSCSSQSSLGAIMSNNNSQLNQNLLQQPQQQQLLHHQQVPKQQQQPRYTSRLSPASMSSTLSASPLPVLGANNVWMNAGSVRQSSPRALPISPVPSAHLYGESTYSQPDYYQTAVHI